MKHSYKKTVIIIILTIFVVVSTIIGSVKSFFDIDETFILFLLLLLISVANLVANAILKFFENKKTISKKGSFIIFPPVDRERILEDVIVNLSKDRYFINIDCSSLNCEEIVNIKQRLYQGLSVQSKINKLKIGNVHNPSKFTFEDFNLRVFNNHSNRRNIFIYDSKTANPYYMKMISEFFSDDNLSKKIKDTYMIYLSDNGASDIKTSVTIEDIIKIFKFNKIELKKENLEIFEDYMINIKNVLPFQKMIKDDDYENIAVYDESLIIPMYFLRIGDYSMASETLIKCFKEENVYHLYVLADCLHLIGEYSDAHIVLENIKLRDYKYSDNNTKKTFLNLIYKLQMHVLKHQGKFKDALSLCNNIPKIDKKRISIYMLDNISNKLSYKVVYPERESVHRKKISDIIEEYKKDHDPFFDIYIAAYIAHNNANEAMKIIDNCIRNFIEINDRMIFNAYYIKGEILRKMCKYQEAYEYYIKASGVLDNHKDINLLDQTYFSTKSLELLDYVRGDASSQINAFKNQYYDFDNHYKDSEKIYGDLLEILDANKLNSDKSILAFNEKLLNVVNNAKKEDLEKILLENIFIIL